MPVTINGTTGITTPNLNSAGTVTTSSLVNGTALAFRNKIINGAMTIDQRNAGASGTGADNYTIDRWGYFGSQASKGTWQQNAGSVTPPAGFTNYLGFTSSSAYTVGASEQFKFYQCIEGFNAADLSWGTANAKTVTLSFQVYSSLTGTFGGALKNGGGTRSYPFSYSIPLANTWTTISITVAGDTTGTWLTTNGAGIYVQFGLGCGSTVSGTAGAWASANYQSVTGATSVVGTNGATFYITGVQLEAGSVATPFENRPIGTELALCQRYYYQDNNEYFPARGFSSEGYIGYSFPVEMRANPTLTVTTGLVSQNSLSCSTRGIKGYITSSWAATPNLSNFRFSAEF